MRILQINSVCGKGSTGKIAVDLYHCLEEQGHECCIAYGRGISPGNITSYRIGGKWNSYIHGILSRITDRQGFYSRHSTWKFAERIRTYQPDIIHLHNLHGYYIDVKILFHVLKKLDKPIVWTFHDCWPFTGHCAHFDYAACEKWKNGCYQCPLKEQYPKSILLDSSRRNYKEKKELFQLLDRMQIVTPSVWLKELVEDSFLKKYPVKVVPNGIDLENFCSITNEFKKKNGLDGKKIILGVAGVWNDRKGLKDFVELAGIIEEPYQIVMVGLSEQQIRNLPEGILGFPKTRTQKELAEVYSAADVFFNPTREDNYPTVNLEAQACGTPVVTYPTGGSPEGVFPGNGYVTSSKDVREAWEIINGGELRVRDDFDRSVFDKRRMAEEYLKCYEEMQ